MFGNELYKQMLDSYVKRYGDPISRQHLAEIVHTSPESLGNVLRTSKSLKIKNLLKSKRYFGRRVFYPAAHVAAVFALNDDEYQTFLKEVNND